MIGIETENGFQRADGTPVPDAALSTTSTNSVQNKVITNYLTGLGSGKYLRTDSKSFSLTVAANSSAVLDVSISVPSGYALLCPTGFTFNNVHFALQEMYVTDSTKIKIRAKNTSSSEVTGSGYVWYLMVKNGN